MSEANLWDRTRDELSPFGVVRRIENAVGAGTPDVVWLLRRYPRVAPVAGWLELKHLPAAPADPRRPLVIPKLLREQVEFAEEWTRAGGRSLFLLQAARFYFLFDAPVARDIFNRALSFDSLSGRARAAGVGRFPTAAILKGMTG